MTWRARALVLMAMAGGLMVASCTVPYEPTLESDAVRSPTAEQEQRGLTWLFPGLVGVPWELGPAYRALRDSGVDGAIRVFDWAQPPTTFFAHLEDVASNEAQVAEVAAEIVAYREAYPDEPIDLVAYSAGGYLAVRTVELLPPNVRVRHVLLAQPDISPGYDLTAALEHVDGHMVCFYCPTDWFLSDIFGRLFGTMDRRFTRAAGRYGFDVEQAVPDAALRGKLVQVGWDETWLAAGHSGNHDDILRYEWNRQILAPYLHN